MQKNKECSINIQELYILNKRIPKEGEKNMSKLKNILIIVIISILFLTMVNAANATDDNDFSNIIDEGSNSNNASNNNINNNNTNNNNTSNNTNNNNTANNSIKSSITNTNTLPKAGATQNIAAGVIVVIFGISAVYAYKKIRDYNV